MKVKIAVLAVAAVVVLGAVIAGIGIMDTPEMALKRISDEVRRDGLEALEAHLTNQALFKYRLAMKARGLPVIQTVAELVADGERAEAFSCRLDRMERAGDSAKAFLEISCAGLTGTVGVNMTRRAGEWMICDLKLDFRGAAPRTGGDAYVPA